MKISVVICTKNEERNINRCLTSVMKVADEVIVVDSFSTDSTQNIVKKFPSVKFVQTAWKGFSTTKNYANSLAQHEYILSLDADEELSLEVQRDILEKKRDLSGVYTVNRLTNYCGHWIRHSGWFPDRHIRLFPKDGSEWQGDIHETLKFEKEHLIQDLKGLVHHYSYYSIDEHALRMENYSILGAKQLVKKNKKHLRLKSYVNPLARFLKCYFLKFGFLDGFYGLVIAILSGKSVYLKYSKAHRLAAQEAAHESKERER